MAEKPRIQVWTGLNEFSLHTITMRLLMARRAQHHKMTRMVTVEQIAGEMDGMQLQRLVVLSTCRTNIPGLLAQRPLQAFHLL